MVTRIKALIPDDSYSIEYLKLCKAQEILQSIAELSRKQRSVWQGVCLVEVCAFLITFHENLLFLNVYFASFCIWLIDFRNLQLHNILRKFLLEPLVSSL